MSQLFKNIFKESKGQQNQNNGHLSYEETEWI